MTKKLSQIREFITSLPVEISADNSQISTLSIGGSTNNTINKGNCVNPGDCSYSTNEGACTNSQYCSFSSNGIAPNGDSCRNPTIISNGTKCGSSNIGGLSECH